MGLQQFERRLERMVEGVFARAFRSSLQPVEIGRRLTREMDLRRTMAPRGTIAPNQFTVVLSSSDRNRFAPIEGELVSELDEVAREHARTERYLLLGPVSIIMQTDDDLSAGMVLISGEMTKGPGAEAEALAERPEAPAGRREVPAGRPEVPVPVPVPVPAPVPGGTQANLVLPDGRRVELGPKPLVVGRFPDSGLVLSDPNVSRYHAEFRRTTGDAGGRGAPGDEYQVSDMGSTNGTKVNGIAIMGAQMLRDGDMVTVGATTVRFEQG